MSTAPAMTEQRRLASYGSPDYTGCTPAQRRRLRHKAKHAYFSRNPGPPKARRHDLAGLTAIWDEAHRIRKPVPSADQLDRLDAVQAAQRADAPRKMSITWPKRFGRRGD